MGDEELLLQLKEEVKYLKERIYALERGQRILKEDILSGNPRSRMQKRLLEKPSNKEERKKKINDEIKIEI